MPRRANQFLPKLQHHKASGEAVVRIDRDFYCGDWGSSVSRIKYDRLVSLWLSNGRPMPSENDATVAPFLDRAGDAFCFSPAESEAARRQAAHAKRKTPLNYGNKPGTIKSESPKRPAKTAYRG